MNDVKRIFEEKTRIINGKNNYIQYDLSKSSNDLFHTSLFLFFMNEFQIGHVFSKRFLFFRITYISFTKLKNKKSLSITYKQ